ncbi:MAG: hypothetical protein ACYDA0_07100 [Candidatus Dormibacteraceae bacterium]
MPDLSHLWQRFLLASSLVAGLALGAAATVFGYSNLGAVNVRWSIFHVDGVPLWTVAVVPLAIVLVAGTIYHWMDGLHHFSEHMRHRRRVHELEAEVASLRGHLDRMLEMPDHSTSRLPRKMVTADALEPVPEVTTPALPEPGLHAETAPANGAKTVHHRPKRATLAVVAEAAEPSPTPLATNGGQETAAAESAPEV